MRNHIVLLMLALGTLGFMLGCQKDLEVMKTNDMTQVQVASEYALQAEELLQALPTEWRDNLSDDAISEFKEGPTNPKAAFHEHTYRKDPMRTSNLTGQQWHAVMALYFCDIGETMTAGSGPWYGHRQSMIEVPQVPDFATGFVDGNLKILDDDQSTMTGSFTVDEAFVQDNGYLTQNLTTIIGFGTGRLFKPQGTLNVHIFMRPNRPDQVVIVVTGWLYYGLKVDPVPREFEEFFSQDELEAHYICLENTPGAEPFYVESLNDFWVYGTVDGYTAVPGIGEGTWKGFGEVTFVVDQTTIGDPPNATSAGRSRIYMAPREDFGDAEYMDFCHPVMLPTQGGGKWPVQLTGGSEEYFNYDITGMGAWIGLGPLAFGNMPAEGIIPSDLKDDGFQCVEYGSTECAGFCVVGDPLPTKVYIIGCMVERASNRCMTVDLTTLGVPLDTAASFTLPDGKTFTGFGGVPRVHQFGDYQMTVQSVVVSEKPGPDGIEFRLVHYFYDDVGNSFWTSDFAIGTPINQFTINIEDKMTVIDGTGVFECARGILRNTAILHLDTYTLDVELTGELCSGC